MGTDRRPHTRLVQLLYALLDFYQYDSEYKKLLDCIETYNQTLHFRTEQHLVTHYSRNCTEVSGVKAVRTTVWRGVIFEIEKTR